jgi:hypothetical protein
MAVLGELDRRIKAWIEIKELNQIPIRTPYVNVPDLPESSQVKIKDVPKLTASVGRLGISKQLGSAVSVLASLISLMDRADAGRLYNSLSSLSSSMDFDESNALEWFTACHDLKTDTIGSAIYGFFLLAEINYKEKKHFDFSVALACLYKVLQSNSIKNKKRVEILFSAARQFPHRFPFVCIRIVSAGNKILPAVENMLSRLNSLDLTREESTSVLDFTMETGWLLSGQDFDQVWKLISRKGSRIQGSLTGGMVPMSSVRFLAGLFRGIEEIKGMDEFLADERRDRVRALFKISSLHRAEETLSSFPKLKLLIDQQIQLDLTEEAISHRITENNHSKLGFTVIIFLEKVLDGVFYDGLMRFLAATACELSFEVMKFLEKLVVESSSENKLSLSDFMLFAGVVARVFSVCTMQDRTALKSFYRALTKLDLSQVAWAVEQLDQALVNISVVSSVLSATSLVLRASGEENRKEFISRISVTSKLIDTFSETDREKALSGLVPAWVEILLSFSLETEEKVIGFLKRISDRNNRSRYLENVVTGLLSELHPKDTVFEDCLAFAVDGYNSSGVIEKLREVEHEVFKKVFRAGGRIKRVDGLMVDLLAVPGFEGEKTEQLISEIRLICNRFSRLAVWEESGDSLFDEFIVHGVGDILRSFVDNPSSLEYVTEEIIELLLDKLIQDGQEHTSSCRMVNPGGTAQTFFGSILPAAIHLFGRKAKALPSFLFEISSEFSRSVGGMTADEKFVDFLVVKLEMEIQQDSVTVLESWLSQKTPPPLQIPEKWSNQKRKEWNSLRAREDTSKMKLFGAVSAIIGSSGSKKKEAILNTAGCLSRQLERAAVSGASSLSLKWDKTMIEQLLSLCGKTPLFEFFKGGNSLSKVDSDILSYLESIPGFMEQDIFHAWRQAALPPLLNCAMEIVLVSGNSQTHAMKMAKSATDAVEFLGYDSANSFLSTLQESIRYTSSYENASAQMEKNFLLPLWKRNSAERLDLLMLGLKDSRLLTTILLERLSLEDRVVGKVKFMKHYATLFITVENALLGIHSDFEKTKIADGLMDSWVFSGTGSCTRKPVMEIFETVELVRDIFRRVKYNSGVVSASEAGEISADMRRKYRDNADSVAIILRWTVDPAREGLLQLLEESQLLLQAAGTDAELMRLLDMHGARSGFLQEAEPYSEDPSALKKFLKTLSEDGELN